MNIHRKITPTIALLLALSAAAPASAPASSLLSGYGGPGQGNQAILGSGLLNGPSGGGGGGAAAGGSSGSGAGSVTSSASGAGAGSGKHGHPASRSKHSTAAASGQADGGGAVRLAYTNALSSHRSVDSGVLGLSSTDLLFMLLALAALVIAGLLTRGLARSTRPRRHAGS
jgi:hypothetical protein